MSSVKTRQYKILPVFLASPTKYPSFLWARKARAFFFIKGIVNWLPEIVPENSRDIRELSSESLY